MTFEEDFPSLKNSILPIEGDIVNNKELDFGVQLIAIRNKCLDKERVKEAIAKIRKRNDDACNDDGFIVDKYLDDMEEELGL